MDRRDILEAQLLMQRYGLTLDEVLALPWYIRWAMLEQL
jgi:hypothetical protein